MCHNQVRDLLTQVEQCIYEDRHSPVRIRHESDLAEITMLVARCLTILESPIDSTQKDTE